METLKPQEQKLIEQLFQFNQKNLKDFLKAVLKKKYSEVISTKDYLIAVGDIPVALSAHMDTVFVKPPRNIFYDRVKNVMWSPEGLGADDRAGVFAILQILKTDLRPTIIFTTEEERGGLGAEALVKDYPEMITPLKYIIDLDRQGSNDCVFYDCNNPDFDDYVESFGFVTNFGSFTDISVICPTWGIAGVNLSVGYYNEHSVSETLWIGQLFDTIEKVKTMLKNAFSAKEFIYIPGFNYKWFDPAYPTDDDWGWDPAYGVPKDVWDQWVKDPEEDIEVCECCGHGSKYDLTPVKIAKGEVVNLCPECMASEKVAICPKCGECFTNITNEKFCYDCRETN